MKKKETEVRRTITEDDLKGRAMWGCMPHPEGHLAFIGLRACDRPDREFTLFPNRVTRIGDEKALDVLAGWIEKHGLKEAKKLTKFNYGASDETIDVDAWKIRISKTSRYNVSMSLRTSGEYLYASFYIDIVVGDSV